MNFPAITTTPCIPTQPLPPDPRCADPEFARAYPGICANQPILIIKPGVALTCILSSIQFEAFVEENGTETLISSGVQFTSSDNTILLIGAISGNATGIGTGLGVGVGNVTVTATYNGMTATASLTVLATNSNQGCCSATDVATVLLVDVSRSMSLAFGGEFSTKLAYAQSLAATYASQTNTQKDVIGLIQFDSTPETDVAIPSAPSKTNATGTATAANGLSTTAQLTGIGLAIQAASTALQAIDASVKVIVLFSDGEDKDTNATNAPVPFAEAFTALGGIIITVGIRAHDDGYDLMSALGTNGYFLNAYPTVATSVSNLLMGLKGYFCAGNCAPVGNVFENVAAPNGYTGWINWNVGNPTAANLIGNGEYDFLPGNGLYMELIGQVTSKTAFSFTAGKNYRVTLLAAGNQVQQQGGDTLSISLIYNSNLGFSGGILFQAQQQIPFTQGFTRLAFSFTPNVTGSANIVLQFLNSAGGPQYGILIDQVELDSITDGTVLFLDAFDHENLQYIPPACGLGVKITGGSGAAIANPSAVTVQDNGGTAVPDVQILLSFQGCGPTPTGFIDTSIVSGNLPAGQLNYSFQLVCSDGSVTQAGVAISQSLSLGANTGLNMSLNPCASGISPRVTSWNIWRNLGNGSDGGHDPLYLLATLPISTLTYLDTESFASFNGRHGIATTPISNNTSTSAGDMTPADVYVYAISYTTANGETLLSPSTTHTVGAGVHSTIVGLPANPPGAVTMIHLWRQENSGGLRFFLLATLTPNTSSYTDLESHADFIARLNPVPAVPVSNTTGSGYGYFPYYGYNCYGYGCLADPPGVQLSDPNPLPDIEAGYVPPTTYTSTKSFTAFCPAGSTQINPVAAANLVIPTSGSTFSGSVTLSPAQTVLSVALNTNGSTVIASNVIQVFGSNDGVNFTAVTNPISQTVQPNQRYLFPVTNPGSYSTYKLVLTAGSTALGSMDFYTQASNNAGISMSSTATSTISQSDADNKATAAAQSAANAALAVAGCALTFQSTETATANCPCGTIGNPSTLSASASYTSLISQADADANATTLAQAAAQAQLNCTASNNTQPITINDNVPSTPYPSVFYVPPTPQLITKATVTIIGWTHTFPSDVNMLLVGPTGKAILLVAHCGNGFPISNVDIILDDAGATNLPTAGLITNGTYKPTQNGGAVFTGCAPTSGYLTTLAGLIGTNPSGSFSLYVQDSAALNAGVISGGWRLTLTTA